MEESIDSLLVLKDRAEKHENILYSLVVLHRPSIPQALSSGPIWANHVAYAGCKIRLCNSGFDHDEDLFLMKGVPISYKTKR